MPSFAQQYSKVQRSSSQIHIVVDNSNLFIGAQHNSEGNGQQDASIRINVGNLVEVIEKHKSPKDITKRIVGGSLPPRTARVWTEWEKSNYTCLLGTRSMDNQEVFLDDMLHAQIQKLILKYGPCKGNVQQMLVLITGDGNTNDNRTSFPEIVSIALEYGWTVELWSWKASLSSKFSDIRTKYPSKMNIKLLDEHRTKITFRQKSPQKPLQKPFEKARKQKLLENTQQQKPLENAQKEKETYIPFLAISITTLLIAVGLHVYYKRLD